MADWQVLIIVGLAVALAAYVAFLIVQRAWWAYKNMRQDPLEGHRL